MGVFATRSPYRPNGLGLSSVKIAGIEYDGQGCLCIDVLGADLIDNTPIYDIKPYLSYADAHPQARCGFVDETPIVRLTVNIPELLAARLQGVNLQTLTDLLALDPRPHYQNKPDKIYGFVFQNFEIKFKVNQNVLTVTEVLTL